MLQTYNIRNKDEISNMDYNISKINKLKYTPYNDIITPIRH